MKKTVAVVALLAFAGCITVFESEYPAVEMSSAGEADVKVQLAGFEAVVTTYDVVYGYETAYRYHSPHRRYHYGYWAPSTVMTETYIPQSRPTSAFLDRATEILELNGFNPKTDKPEYRIEVKFDGPFVTDGATNASLPRDLAPEELTAERALELLAARAARGGTTRGKTTKKATVKKTATVKKSAAAKKTTKKATTAKKTAKKASKSGVEPPF